MKHAKDDQPVEEKERPVEDQSAEEAAAAAESDARAEDASAEQSQSDEATSSQKTESSDAEEAAEELREPTLEELLEEAKAKAEENYNAYLRSVADLDTYRRRVNREKDELKQYAISGLLEDFLPIYDNLSLGLVSAENTSDPKVVVQGLQMVLSQFKNLLQENGIEEVAPQKGDDFDPNVAEAFQTQPSDEIEEGKVLTLMRKGFSLKGRLIRPASVIVSGGPAEEG